MLIKNNHKQGEIFCENCKKVVNKDSNIVRESKLAKDEDGREVTIESYSKVTVCPECCMVQA